MPVLHGQLQSPASAGAYPSTVRVTLKTGGSTTPGYLATGEVVGSVTVPTDATGAWSVNLIANSLITPAGTYYEVAEQGAVSTIVMPAAGGPYAVKDLLRVPPPTVSAMSITGVDVQVNSAHVATTPTINIQAGTNMNTTGSYDPTTNTTTITLASTAGGAGPATTITSETTYNQTPAVGTLATYAREDHTHGTPPTPTSVLPWSYPGTLQTTSPTSAIYNDTGRPLTITGVRATVGTAPTGSAVTVDVQRNGTSLWTLPASRPTIAAATTTSGSIAPTAGATLAAGDRLTANITQVGSTTPGSDLTIQVQVAG